MLASYEPWGLESMVRTLTGKFLLRDWRSGELSILLLALVLAVSVVVGISGFVSRLQGALLSESCLLYTSPSPRDGLLSRMPSSA